MALSPDLYVEKLYVDGYQPSSLDAPHSSLHRTLTWVGMGCWLLLMPGLGTTIFGAATKVAGTQEHATEFLILGIVMSVVAVALGSLFIHMGRKNYRDYVKRSGRII